MITVVIATKNGSVYIERAIKSVQAQTEKDLEIIVISDGSTDTTARIVTHLSTTDSRIKFIELKQNVGPGRARNLAIIGGVTEGTRIPPAQGTYIALIDDDDIWNDINKLTNQKKYLDEHLDVVAVGSADVDFVRENGSHIFTLHNQTDSKKIQGNMLSYNPLIASSVLFRKETYITVGGFSSLYLAEDYELWLKMGQVGSISNITGAKTSYTVRDGSASKSRRQEMNRTVLALIQKYRHSYPGYLKAILKARARIILFKIKNILK